MLYALTSAYSRTDYDNEQQGRPLETNIGKLFSLFAWGLNTVQESAELVKLWDDIEYAKGSVLDRYGANWGVKRFNENDALYRLAIRVKVMSQLSGGDTDTIINAAADLLGVENPDIEFEDVFPAKIALYVDWLLLTQERQDLIEPIAWSIKRLLAAGVGMRLYVRTYHTFRFAVDVKHGGTTGAFISAVPVGQDRENLGVLGVGYGGFALADFQPPPVGRDRSEREDVAVQMGVGARTDFVVVPVGEDRTSLGAVLTAHGAVHTKQVDISPPDTERPLRGRQSGAGGVFYRTNIKPKRID